MSHMSSLGKRRAVEQKARKLARQFASESLVRYAMETDWSQISQPFEDPAPVRQLSPGDWDSMDSILVEACFDETLEGVGITLESVCDLGLDSYIRAFIKGWVQGCFDRLDRLDSFPTIDDPDSTEFALHLTLEV